MVKFKMTLRTLQFISYCTSIVLFVAKYFGTSEAKLVGQRYFWISIGLYWAIEIIIHGWQIN